MKDNYAVPACFTDDLEQKARDPNLKIKGRFIVEHIRDGKVINKFDITNGITIEGKNYLLNVGFHNTPAQLHPWYIGLVDNAGFTAFDETDTYDDIDQAGNGWDTWGDYTDANNSNSAVTRPEWKEGAASNKQMTTDTPQAIYDVVAAGDGDVVKGVFIVGGTSAQTKADHAAGSPPNILWSTAAFASTITVATSDQLKITYTIST